MRAARLAAVAAGILVALLLALVASLGAPREADAHRPPAGLCDRLVAAADPDARPIVARECRAMLLEHRRLHAARPMLASCYADPTDGFLGRPTASGAIVSSRSLFVAHRSLPLGTKVRIFVNGRAVTAVVADRGPYAGHRDLDVSWAVARRLGYPMCDDFGVRTVRVFVFRARR